MICRKRPCPAVSGGSGFIRPSIICAPAFQAVPWLGQTVCSPVVLYTSPLASEHTTKRHRVYKTSWDDSEKLKCDNATEPSGLPTDGSVASDKEQKAAVEEKPQRDVALTSMFQMYSWGHRHRGVPCKGESSSSNRCKCDIVVALISAGGSSLGVQYRVQCGHRAFSTVGRISGTCPYLYSSQRFLSSDEYCAGAPVLLISICY